MMITVTHYDCKAFLCRIGLIPGVISTTPVKPKSVSISDIQGATAAEFGIHRSEMKSSRRSRDVARPRQVAMYLSKRLTPRSLPEIGRCFGWRDHTTVIHAVRQIEKLRAEDSELDMSIRRIARAVAP